MSAIAASVAKAAGGHPNRIEARQTEAAVRALTMAP